MMNLRLKNAYFEKKRNNKALAIVPWCACILFKANKECELPI